MMLFLFVKNGKRGWAMSVNTNHLTSSEFEDFNEGVLGVIDGDYLRWNHEGCYIYVSDLPTKLINELKQQSFSMACIIVEDYIDDNSDGVINDCGA